MPVKDIFPVAVPDFAAPDEEAAQIVKAISEPKEKLTAAKEFVGGK